MYSAKKYFYKSDFLFLQKLAQKCNFLQEIARNRKKKYDFSCLEIIYLSRINSNNKRNAEKEKD